MPYSAHHVPTYHEWMQDEEIQKATASEPLTLEEEYSMQRSWRKDVDKLTFIVCTHAEGQEYESVAPGRQDAPEWMVGDVNLFLYNDEDEEVDDGQEGEGRAKSVIGELEIMIARRDQQRKGLAQETLRAFISYIQSSLDSILAEYAGKGVALLKHLRVKIDQDNVQSLKLFERIGFLRTSAEPNYFGEVELRAPVVGGRLIDVERKIGLEGFGKVVRYEVDSEQ